MTPNNYTAYLHEASQFVPQERIYTDELRRLAWGTDAGFYRLIPQIIIRSTSEEEVARLLRLAHRYEVPVTFRAAGTSLSGQAISDSVLIVAGKHWERYTIGPEGKSIRLQPGIVGQRVNELLAPYGRKFAPDPASVKSAMVGGIVMNNASGMNCGTHANSDRTLLSARIILADGTLLDTGDVQSRQAFAAGHGDFIREINRLRDKVRSNQPLMERIRYKYAIKNVTGLNILPFALFDDPFDIIAHLMVGSEGTLAFLSEVTMRTEHDYPHKASAMLYFKSIQEACRAVVDLKQLAYRVVKSAEMLDYKSLSSVNDPVYLRYKGEADEKGLTALLVETKADNPEELQQHIAEIAGCLAAYHTCTPVRFTDKPEEYQPFWAIRSGIFPSVGGTRQPGTTCLIEDVAFHIKQLPEATAELQQLLARHGYDDACIYGHALEGNYHFIINQNFHTESEVKRYADLMEEVKQLVVDKYDGSLKAEHGTGRNMAPYVRYEWGDEAFGLMKAVKQLFDPKGLLNPGVIFNDDPHCHLKNFKPLPLLHQEAPLPNAKCHQEATAIYSKINRCIECGFCEVNCLSCGLTLSSRQRIVIQRELSHLKENGNDPERISLLTKQYQYPGNETCAGDGLCSLSCPMGISTADLTHLVRQQQLPPLSWGYRMGDYAARHFAGVKSALRPVLGLAHVAHNMLGTSLMSSITRSLHSSLGLPQWFPSLPKPYLYKGTRIIPADATYANPAEQRPQKRQVVYFPSCINQTMGLPSKSKEEQALVNKMIALLHKAGFEVIFPERMEQLCCGTIWESKGMMDIADRKLQELDEALWKASEGGRIPVLCDQSPCLHRMRQHIRRMKLYEPAEFIYTILRSYLEFTPTTRPVAVHITCSMREMGLGPILVALAHLCSTEVLVPEEIGCCGFAGDRGFTHPELNAYALRKLKPQIEAHHIPVGYSNSRTCEIGLSTHSGIPYVSIAYLVDECTTSKQKAL